MKMKTVLIIAAVLLRAMLFASCTSSKGYPMRRITRVHIDTGELLENPVTYTVEEFKAMLASEIYPDFATDNTWVTFDEKGGMITEGTGRSAKYGITSADWDYITVQQGSDHSGLAEKFSDLQGMLEYINEIFG